MRKSADKHRKKGSARKSGRAKSDAVGRRAWDWETSTGVFETHISEEQLAELEASQFTILDAPKPQNPVSYWEWREKSQPAPVPLVPKTPDGAIKRLIKFISRG
jgi:hypothetical protein